MEKNWSIQLSDEFVKFCELNGYDTESYAKKLFEKAFNEVKYGTSPISRVHIPMEKEIQESEEEEVEEYIEETALPQTPQPTPLIKLIQKPNRDIYGGF